MLFISETEYISSGSLTAEKVITAREVEEKREGVAKDEMMKAEAGGGGFSDVCL